MYVGRRMTREVIALSPEDTIRDANRILQENRIHHLPVVEGEELVGIVSDSDIRKWILREEMVDEGGAASRRTGSVGEIMTRDVITVSPGDTIEDALLILHRRRFGALPVVEGRKLVGIVTKADILAAFIDTLSIEGIGVRIEVILPQSANSLLRLIQKLAEMQVEIRSLVLSPYGQEFAAFLRIGTIDVATVKTRLRGYGFKVPELADFLG
ncbi:MAG TPA: CBS and ACT domain-containing protein [Candidatus Deferrimicrobiaceae bacterium]|nr:CBS and ACT domain-containing protein [Candidatus Deferrimicrobiaceae bacterium]